MKRQPTLVSVVANIAQCQFGDCPNFAYNHVIHVQCIGCINNLPKKNLFDFPQIIQNSGNYLENDDCEINNGISFLCESIQIWCRAF